MTFADQNLDHEEAIRARARAIWERVGRPDGKDIEHWRQAEEEIAAELRFRLVVEAAPNAMVMVNRAGEIVMVNAQAERVFGYPRAELLGQPVEMLVPEQFRGHHPELREAFFIEPLARPMGAGRDLFGLKKDGSEFPVEIGLNPIETDEGTMPTAFFVNAVTNVRANCPGPLRIAPCPVISQDSRCVLPVPGGPSTNPTRLSAKPRQAASCAGRNGRSWCSLIDGIAKPSSLSVHSDRSAADRAKAPGSRRNVSISWRVVMVLPGPQESSGRHRLWTN